VRGAEFVARCFSRCRSSFCIFCGGLALRFLVAPGRFRGSTFFGFYFPLRGFASTFAGSPQEGEDKGGGGTGRPGRSQACQSQAAEKRRVPASNETVGTGFSYKPSKSSTRNLSGKSPFGKKGKDEAVTTWVNPHLIAEVKSTQWTSSGEMRHPVYLGLRADKQAKDVVLEREKARE